MKLGQGVSSGCLCRRYRTGCQRCSQMTC